MRDATKNVLRAFMEMASREKLVEDYLEMWEKYLDSNEKIIELEEENKLLKSKLKTLFNAFDRVKETKNTDTNEGLKKKNRRTS